MRRGENEPIELAVTIRRRDVLHFLGYPPGRQPAGPIGRRLDVLRDEARGLAEPRGAYRRLPVEESAAVGLEPMSAAALVIGLVTAGSRIEAAVAERVDRGEATDAMLLDAMGSVAAEEAADRLGVEIVGDGRAEPQVPSLSCRISPGYGRWPLSAQPGLFERLPHRRLGIELLPSLLMTPRKSISFAMWIGADARPIAGLSGCSHCNLESCRYRLTRKDSRR